MSYCHHCGKKNVKGDLFCENCGEKLAEFIEDVKNQAVGVIGDIEEEVEEIIERGSKRNTILLILIILIIVYIILDLWAISQLTPVISLSSIFASISNFDYDSSLSNTYVESTMRIKNPTIVPVIFARIAYDANYGNTKVADGKTGFFIIGPNSQKDIPVGVKIYHVNTALAGGKWLWNTITGKKERQYVNIYADIGLTKFKIMEFG